MTTNNGMAKWVIWACAAFFYFYEYVLRVSPSVMVPELMSAFHVNATILGLLVAFYFYAYAPMQVPVGLLIDHFGAKKLLIFATLVCAFGSILFGSSFHFLEASFGRVLLGFGSSFGFITMVYVCSHWFPKSKRALLIGLANSLGMLGAFCGQGPLSMALHTVNWRVAMILLGVIGISLAVVIYFIVQADTPPHKKTAKILFAELQSICKSRYTWMHAMVTLLMYMTTLAVADLWGVPFLQSVYHLDKRTAGFAISMIFLGWLAGGPLIGLLSDRLGKRKKLIIICIILMFCVLTPVIYYPHTPLVLLYCLLFAVGFFSSGALLNFTLVTEINPPHIKASAIAFTNFFVNLGGAFGQTIVGVLLDMSWSGTQEQGINIYSVKDYQSAFLIFPICLCLALILSIFLRESTPTEHAVEPLSSS